MSDIDPTIQDVELAKTILQKTGWAVNENTGYKVTIIAKEICMKTEPFRAEIERLRAEAAKFPVQLSEVVERSTDDMNYWKDRAEKAEAEHKRLHDAASELLEVANLRGDNDLPHPADDPKLWTGRMQDAWQDLAEALAQQEPVCPHCGRSPKPGDGCAHAAQQDCLARRQQ